MALFAAVEIYDRPSDVADDIGAHSDPLRLLATVGLRPKSEQAALSLLA